MSFQAKQKALKARRFRPRTVLSKAQKNAVKKIATSAITKVSEKKFLDQASGPTQIGYDAPVISLISMPVQGDSVNTRDGDNLFIKSLRLKGQVATSGQDVRVRVIVFQWMEDNATSSPTASDILQDVTQYDILNSPYKINGPKHFKVLMDRRYVLDSPGQTWSRLFQANLKLPQKKIQFNAGLATGVGQVYVMTLSDTYTVASGSGGNVTWYSRLRYLDN